MLKLAKIAMAFLRAITHFPASADRLPFLQRSMRATHQFPFQNSLRKKLTDDEKKKLSITPLACPRTYFGSAIRQLIGKKVVIFQR